MTNYVKDDEVVILNILINGDRGDCHANYIEEVISGPKKGFHLVEYNTIKVHVELEKLMSKEDYMKIYNEDKSKLPENSAKEFWFKKEWSA